MVEVSKLKTLLICLICRAHMRTIPTICLCCDILSPNDIFSILQSRHFSPCRHLDAFRDHCSCMGTIRSDLITVPNVWKKLSGRISDQILVYFLTFCIR